MRCRASSRSPVLNGAGDGLVRAEHLGPDLLPRLRGESLDLVQAAEADQHQSHQLKRMVLGGCCHGGVQAVDQLPLLLGTRASPGEALPAIPRHPRRRCARLPDRRWPPRHPSAVPPAPPASCRAGPDRGSHLGDSIGAGCHDEEASARAAAHAGDLMVLEQPHRLTEQGAAHGLPLYELWLRPHELTGPQSFGSR